MDDWDWWRRKLAGEKMEMTEGNPHAGFYRWPKKAAYGAPRLFTPVAYWPSENSGELCCRVGNADVSPQHGRDIWVSVGNNPVTEESYRAVAEHDLPWPDEPETIAISQIGHNRPPPDNSYEGLRDAIEAAASEAIKRLEGPPIADQAEADKIANLADGLAEMWKRAEEGRKVERRPYDDAIEQIQGRWLPLTRAAKAYEQLKRQLITPWLQKLQVKAAEETRASAAAGTATSAPPRPRAGTRGRATTLKSRRRAEIVDYAACLEFFKDGDDIRSLVQSLADRAVRTGAAVPGTKVIEEQQAV